MQKAEFEAFLKKTIIDVLRSVDFSDVVKKGIKVSEQEYSTIKETADHFKITKQTIYNWVKKKVITIYKMGGRSLCKIKDIEEKMKNTPHLFGNNREYSYRIPGYNIEKREQDRYHRINWKIMDKLEITNEEKAFYLDYCERHSIHNRLQDE